MRRAGGRRRADIYMRIACLRSVQEPEQRVKELLASTALFLAH